MPPTRAWYASGLRRSTLMVRLHSIRAGNSNLGWVLPSLQKVHPTVAVACQCQPHRAATWSIASLDHQPFQHCVDPPCGQLRLAVQLCRPQQFQHRRFHLPHAPAVVGWCLRPRMVVSGGRKGESRVGPPIDEEGGHCRRGVVGGEHRERQMLVPVVLPVRDQARSTFALVFL